MSIADCIKDRTYLATCIIFTISLVLSLLYFYPFQNSKSLLTNRTPGVLGRTYPPRTPDLYKNEGGNITLGDVTAVVAEDTFPWEVYLKVDETVKTDPVYVQGYWQISPKWEVWFHSYFNDAKILHPQKKYVLSFSYKQSDLITDQGVIFKEDALYIAHANSTTDNWRIYRKSIIDLRNDTVSVITDKGGYFMIVAGFTRKQN